MMEELKVDIGVAVGSMYSLFGILKQGLIKNHWWSLPKLWNWFGAKVFLEVPSMTY